MSAALPVQIHLSLTSKPDEMIVYWITEDQPASSRVEYGLKKWDLRMVALGRQLERYQYQGIRKREGYRSGFIHEVVIRALPVVFQPLTIFYRVGDPDDGWSDIRSFRTRSVLQDAPIRFAFNADSVRRNLPRSSFSPLASVPRRVFGANSLPCLPATRRTLANRLKPTAHREMHA